MDFIPIEKRRKAYLLIKSTISFQKKGKPIEEEKEIKPIRFEVLFPLNDSSSRKSFDFGVWQGC